MGYKVDVFTFKQLIWVQVISLNFTYPAFNNVVE